MTSLEKLENIIEQTNRVSKSFKYNITTIDMVMLTMLNSKNVIELFKDINIDINIYANMIVRAVKKSGESSMDLNTEHQLSAPLYALIEEIKKDLESSPFKFNEITFIQYILGTDAYASLVLQKNGVTNQLIAEMLSVQNGKKNNSSFSNSFNEILHEILNDNDSNIFDNKTFKKSKDFNIEEFAVNLNKAVKDGKYDNVFGRDDEIKRAIQILGRKKKNNPILLGEPGVGKTAIAIGLAQRIVEGNVPKAIKEFNIYELNLNSLVSGTKYRGEYEKKIEILVEEIQKDPHSVLFIDEIHMLSKDSSEKNILSNVLKPYLAEGSLRCIGATTYEEYKKSIENDKALSRRFQEIKVAEPTVSQTTDIIKSIQNYYESYHNVSYSNEVIDTVSFLAKKYIKDRLLPDSAIDLIDEAGSYKKMMLKSNKKVEIADIENIISCITKTDKISTDKKDKNILKNLNQKIKSEVFGQNEAIDTIYNSIIRAKSGFKEENQPIGSFLFTGTTGVGKTEVARSLADKMSCNFIRYDMAEFSEEHSVAKLLGSPAGYVGYEDGGKLITDIKNNPQSILLLDEIEKAHPKIFNTLLSVMEEGILTDSKGRKAYFNDVIIIMTSNAGAVVEKTVGFNNDNGKNKKEKAVQNTFSPEFRNRLTAMISFNDLDETVLLNVTNKMIKKINQKMLSNKVFINLTVNAKKEIVREAKKQNMGARPIKRILANIIEDKISKEIMFGELSDGGTVSIGYANKSFNFKYKNIIKKNSNKSEESFVRV